MSEGKKARGRMKRDDNRLTAAAAEVPRGPEELTHFPPLSAALRLLLRDFDGVQRGSRETKHPGRFKMGPAEFYRITPADRYKRYNPMGGGGLSN